MYLVMDGDDSGIGCARSSSSSSAFLIPDLVYSQGENIAIIPPSSLSAVPLKMLFLPPLGRAPLCNQSARAIAAPFLQPLRPPDQKRETWKSVSEQETGFS